MPQIIRVTKTFSFEAAHALQGYDGACRNIHGHSYKLKVTVKGPVVSEIYHPKDGMVMDFKELKTLVQENIITIFDHALILQKGTAIDFPSNHSLKVVHLPFSPTSENMISYFAGVIKSNLPNHLQLFSLLLSETDTSFVEWFESDQRTMQNTAHNLDI
jgi:6-pyruvoyltetrahydropterin/6-carboxytetrahydropterin synthase